MSVIAANVSRLCDGGAFNAQNFKLITKFMIEIQNFMEALPPHYCKTDVSGSALVLGDCLEVMKYIPSKSVQLILADLPYNMTACKWDSIIPLEPLWEQYKRIIKGQLITSAWQDWGFCGKLFICISI